MRNMDPEWLREKERKTQEVVEVVLVVAIERDRIQAEGIFQQFWEEDQNVNINRDKRFLPVKKKNRVGVLMYIYLLSGDWGKSFSHLKIEMYIHIFNIRTVNFGFGFGGDGMQCFLFFFLKKRQARKKEMKTQKEPFFFFFLCGEGVYTWITEVREYSYTRDSNLDLFFFRLRLAWFPQFLLQFSFRFGTRRSRKRFSIVVVPVCRFCQNPTREPNGWMVFIVR